MSFFYDMFLCDTLFSLIEEPSISCNNVCGLGKNSHTLCKYSLMACFLRKQASSLVTGSFPPSILEKALEMRLPRWPL